MVNGKNKGNTFERKISKMLSERFSEHTGLETGFIRNADSGSYFGGKNQKRAKTHDLSKATFGDIICPNDFAYTIECKHYKTAPTMKAIVSQDCKQWDTWIKQAKQDADNSLLGFMLIIKYNNIDTFVFLEEEHESINVIMKYKGLFAYTLSDVLTLDNEKFFL